MKFPALSCLPSSGTSGFRSLLEQKHNYLRDTQSPDCSYFLSSWLHEFGIIIW